jgi:hypothetical protein
VVTIERSQDGVSFSHLTSYAATAAAFSDKTCRANTTYYYRMQSKNSGGVSGYSAIVSVKTSP